MPPQLNNGMCNPVRPNRRVIMPPVSTANVAAAPVDARSGADQSFVSMSRITHPTLAPRAIWADTEDLMNTERTDDPAEATADLGRAAWTHTSDAMWHVTAAGIVTDANPAVPELLGWTPAVLVGRPFEDLLHPDDSDLVARAHIAAGAGLRPSPEVRLRTAAGAWRPVRLAVIPVGSGRLITGQDITDRRAVTDRLAHAEFNLMTNSTPEPPRPSDSLPGHRFDLVYRHAPIGMAVMTVDGRFLTVNPALSHILRATADDLVGEDARRLTHPSDRPGEQELVTQLLTGSCESFRLEKRFVRSDGTAVWVDQQASLIRDSDGHPHQIVAQFVDVDDRRKEYESLRYEASHDPLTGLANRTLLSARLRDLHREGRTDRALLYLDIDYFKSVNDRYGHAGGDAVLTEVAHRIRSLVRTQDTVARIGGDEFIVIIEGTPSPDAAVNVAEKIRTAVSRPIAVQDEHLSVTVSVGVSCCMLGPSDPDSMLSRADEALYRAKREGRDRIVHGSG